MVKISTKDDEWRFTGFYGSSYAHSRNEIWDSLRNLRRGNRIPWCVCGDFNENLNASKKLGAVPRERNGRKPSVRYCEIVD